MDETTIIRDIINRFFNGESLKASHSEKIGFLWISKHGEDYDTLTFEPKHGGQYEIAVRIRCKTESGEYEYQGYSVENPLKDLLRGHNTRGH